MPPARAALNGFAVSIPSVIGQRRAFTPPRPANVSGVIARTTQRVALVVVLGCNDRCLESERSDVAAYLVESSLEALLIGLWRRRIGRLVGLQQVPQLRPARPPFEDSVDAARASSLLGARRGTRRSR